jgi:hypothetical protein
VVDERQAAEWLDVEVKTMRAWRLRGRGPRYLKYGTGKAGAVRYRIGDLEAFLAASAVNPNGPP